MVSQEKLNSNKICLIPKRINSFVVDILWIASFFILTWNREWALKEKYEYWV